MLYYKIQKAQVSDSRAIMALLSAFPIMIFTGFILRLFNPLPNNRIFNETKLVAFEMKYTTQNLLRITFSFNDLMLKTNRLKKDIFCKDRLIFRLDDPVANMSIRHVYYAWGAREKTYPLKRVSFCLVASSALVHLANFQLSYHKF